MATQAEVLTQPFAKAQTNTIKRITQLLQTRARFSGDMPYSSTIQVHFDIFGMGKG